MFTVGFYADFASDEFPLIFFGHPTPFYFCRSSTITRSCETSLLRERENRFTSFGALHLTAVQSREDKRVSHDLVTTGNG